jgi:tetratricopeptide (TPR) repeat protein
MGKKRKKENKPKKESSKRSGDASPENQEKSALWKSLLTSLAALALFFGILEAALALFGVNPVLQNKDPFVGFASNIPLFVEKTGPDGRTIMTTARNKLTYFNMQQFPKEKEPGTYRIFCLGGSTTYGRPYNDKTSFSGWLRELLPVADTEYHWEVINAGGISYASYRAARLMKELVRYEPDLFIVYSGHNEFLEERTYGTLRDTPDAVKIASSLLSRTRTWAAVREVLDIAGALPERGQGERVQLTGEVNTILGRSAGPERYKRDDSLRDHILMHYRISLERMVEIARSAGAEIIFVTPASNLKDASPFKSQHTNGLSEEDILKSEELLSTAMVLIKEKNWSDALEVLDEAIPVDPRYAELHYRRGRVLFALGKYDASADAFRRARDEDVCPLRALTSMRDMITEVAEKEGVTLVDFIELIEHNAMTEYDHDIPGKEYFLDHVHPTIAGNRMLAVELVEVMADKGVVQLSDRWGEDAIAEVSDRVTGGINRKEHARALVNLARVLSWAGKFEDAARLAHKAMTFEEAAPGAYVAASSILATLYRQEGNIENARLYYLKALKGKPGSPQIHLQYGLMFLNKPLRNFEVAAAHIFLATVLWPESDMAWLTFGLSMAERHRYSLAYSSLMEAIRINPQNADAASAIERLKKMLDPDALNPVPPKVTLNRYPSGAPSKIVQVRPDASGQNIPNGIWTEWYESGRLKHFADYSKGVLHGFDISWGPDGGVISKMKYQHGKRIRTAQGHADGSG